MHPKYKPLIAIPHCGTICASTVQSLVCLNPVPDVIFPSSSLIMCNRNFAAKSLLEGDHTHLFFIDSDVGFQAEAFARVLVQSGQDSIAAGIYPYRCNIPTGGKPYPISDGDMLSHVNKSGFARVKAAATGFMSIPRTVLETMLKTYQPNELFALDYDRERDVIIGEDVAFCKRWTDLGGQVWMDCRSRLTHQGQEVFQAQSFEDWFATTQTYKDNPVP